MGDTRYPETARKWVELDQDEWMDQIQILYKAFAYVKQWGTAIDGGAFVGSWTRVMSERFARVVAFEPCEANADCLRGNVPTAEVYELALSDAPGIETYRIRRGGFMKIGGGVDEIECTTLDGYKYEGLGLLKLDVEGREYAALMGAKRTIMDHSPVIVIEMKKDSERVRDKLVEYGYALVEDSGIDQVWVK